MAKNQKRLYGRYLRLEVDSGVESGDPVKVGSLTGVAVTDADEDDYATIDTEGVYELEVEADEGGNGGTTIDVGDPIYIDSDYHLNVDDSEILFGFALDSIDSTGDTEEIAVLLDKSIDTVSQ